METHEFRAMNTGILLAAEISPRRAGEAFERVEALVRAHERRFTRFSPESELSALNRSAGSWFAASTEMYALLELALELHAQTGGLFDPAVLPALERAGYDRSMDDLRARGPVPPSPASSFFSVSSSAPQCLRDEGFSSLLQGEGFSSLLLDPSSRRVLLPPGTRIDLGGIAKGWIAEQAARALGAYAPACVVDAGGDMYAVGLPAGEEAWSVAVEDPFDPQRDLTTLAVAPGAIATSTITRRRWLQAGVERHHLIDPRTGQPAETPWVSVTVTAPHTARAEVLAKALLIGGPASARELLGRQPEAAFLAVDRGGRIWDSQTLDQEVFYAEFIPQLLR